MKKMWSINVFAKAKDGSYSKDIYGPKYKWSYDEYNLALKSFDGIPSSEGMETLCELMEFDFETSDLKCLDSKYSNHFASTYIIPGKHQDEIR
ncbi:MAG: hypothetical protein JST17_05230 [Bacteroidetes bacterium]|nr:hypothetical protein [Bacteroidota bacterium]